jgi:hypothetical protein
MSRIGLNDNILEQSLLRSDEKLQTLSIQSHRGLFFPMFISRKEETMRIRMRCEIYWKIRSTRGARTVVISDCWGQKSVFHQGEDDRYSSLQVGFQSLYARGTRPKRTPKRASGPNRNTNQVLNQSRESYLFPPFHILTPRLAIHV